MALSTRILRIATNPLCFLRRFCTAVEPVPPQKPADVFDELLRDTERLFGSLPTGSLVSSLAVLSAFALDPVVELGIAALQSPVVMGNRVTRSAVSAAVNATVFRHFCAGEGREEAVRVVRAMWQREGLRCLLAYAVEQAVDAPACDRNLAGVLDTVDAAASLPPTSASVCIKMTALCPTEVLERVSDLLRWQAKNPTFSLPWKSHSFPILSAASSPLYLTPSCPPPLSDEDESELRASLQRLRNISARCADANLKLLIDAEHAQVQPAIDYFTYAAVLEFNADRPVVYGTIQAYLKDSRERTAEIMRAAEAAGMHIGIKLVRGAYLTRETQSAAAMGVPSPIHHNIQATHACYDDCAAFLLDKVRQGSAAVVLATHNANSGRLAAGKAEELRIGKEAGEREGKVQFAQLMGMADGLSLGLRKAGFQVNKYLPYGPVDQIIPYLIRRADENKGFLSSSARDRHLIWKELKRRLMPAA